MNFRFLIFFATILLASAGLAQAQFQYANGSLLTMDEVPFQPINGLTVKGVTFADTAGAAYNAGDGGIQFYTQDPVIEGNTAGEAITMTFVTPITSLSFGFALTLRQPLPTQSRCNSSTRQVIRWAPSSRTAASLGVTILQEVNSRGLTLA